MESNEAQDHFENQKKAFEEYLNDKDADDLNEHGLKKIMEKYKHWKNEYKSLGDESSVEGRLKRDIHSTIGDLLISQMKMYRMEMKKEQEAMNGSIKREGVVFCGDQSNSEMVVQKNKNLVKELECLKNQVEYMKNEKKSKKHSKQTTEDTLEQCVKKMMEIKEEKEFVDLATEMYEQGQSDPKKIQRMLDSSFEVY